MRLVRWVAAILVFGLASAAPVLAETDPADSWTQSARNPDIQGILAELAAYGEATDDDVEAAWVSELAGYYAAPGTAPLWVSKGRITARGEAIMRELSSADQYGLDASQFDLPAAGDSDAKAEAKLSLAIIKYVWHARGGRVDPSQLSLWLDQTPRVVYASSAIRQFIDAPDVAAALRAQHPQHQQFEALRQALLRARGQIEEPKPAPLVLTGSKITEGQRHIDVALVRRRLGLSTDKDNETLADEDLIEGVRQFMRQAGFGKKKRFIDDDVRAALNNADANAKPRDNKAVIEKIIINMERWRWVPEDFGALHVWNNLPEFESRIVKNGEIIHRERIIIGQPHTQTPVFSDAMSRVDFQPTWGLPPSIKLRQFGNRGDISASHERRNMKIVDDDGTVIRPSRINWGKVDIRHIPIVQGPGPGNPLGRLKFVFPNAHDVYMHDTPDKGLFNSSVRTFSHGCMRLRNPQQYAEIILRERRGWTPADVAKHLTYKDTIKIDLAQHIPVHVTYFTLVADESGTLRSLNDIYGHDKRIAEAMNGVPVAKIAARDPALAQLRENQELARRSGARDSRRSRQLRVASYSKPRSGQRSGSKPKPFFFFNPN